MLSEGSFFLCICHSPVRGEGSPFVGVEAPKFELQCAVRQDWNAPTGRGATQCSSTGVVQREVCSLVLPETLFHAYEYIVVDTAFGPALTM